MLITLGPLFPYASRVRMAPQEEEGADGAGGVEASDDFGDGLDDDGDSPTDGVEMEAEEDESLTLASLAQEKGLEGFEGDDLAIAEKLMGGYAERQQYEQQARQLQERVRQLEAYYAHQHSQPQQTSQPSSEPRQFAYPSEGPLSVFSKVPEFDPHWLSLVKHDEEGNLVSPNGVDPSLPQKITAYADWQRRAQQTLLSDPRAVIRHVWENDPEVQYAIQQQVQYGIQQYAQQQQVRELERSVRDRVYQMDEKGHPKMDAAGNVQVTPWGQAYANHIQRLYAHGSGLDLQTAHETAMSLADRDVPPQVKQEKPPKSRQLQQMRRAASKTPKRNGSGRRPPQRDEGDLAAAMMARFKEEGIGGMDEV